MPAQGHRVNGLTPIPPKTTPLERRQLRLRASIERSQLLLKNVESDINPSRFKLEPDKLDNAVAIAREAFSANGIENPLSARIKEARKRSSGLFGGRSRAVIKITITEPVPVQVKEITVEHLADKLRVTLDKKRFLRIVSGPFSKKIGPYWPLAGIVAHEMQHALDTGLDAMISKLREKKDQLLASSSWLQKIFKSEALRNLSSTLRMVEAFREVRGACIENAVLLSNKANIHHMNIGHWVEAWYKTNTHRITHAIELFSAFLKKGNWANLQPLPEEFEHPEEYTKRILSMLPNENARNTFRDIKAVCSQDAHRKHYDLTIPIPNIPKSV